MVCSQPGEERTDPGSGFAGVGARCPAALEQVVAFYLFPFLPSFTCTGNLEEQIIQSAAGLQKTLMKALFI